MRVAQELRRILAATVVILSSPRLVAAQGDGGGICYMQYSMADNNLYGFLVNDVNEMQASALVRDPTLTFWDYIDGNEMFSVFSAAGFFTGINNVKFPNGTDAPKRYTGARYLTWDHSKEALIQTETLGEVNSDTIETIANFMTVALTDCVAKGKTQYMLLMSSHGSGFGFGGDEEIPDSGRRLVQSNLDVAEAIRQGLDSVEGAPAKLDLLGFDACLQASLESMKDFQGVTKYYLASEAIAPGTGKGLFGKR